MLIFLNIKFNLVITIQCAKCPTMNKSFIYVFCTCNITWIQYYFINTIRCSGKVQDVLLEEKLEEKEAERGIGNVYNFRLVSLREVKNGLDHFLTILRNINTIRCSGKVQDVLLEEKLEEKEAERGIGNVYNFRLVSLGEVKNGLDHFLTILRKNGLREAFYTTTFSYRITFQFSLNNLTAFKNCRFKGTLA
jgi:hypothetical protein